MKILLTAVLVFFINKVSGQTKTFSISGTVTDSITKETLLSASVSFRHISAGVKQVILTDQRGYFMIPNLPAGEYILDISHTGYLPSFKIIQLKVDEIVPVSLQKLSASLDNVTVSAEKKIVDRTTDKIILNVSESAVTASDNLYNIILKVSGITEASGSLNYQGRPVTVVFDGKANNLSGDDLKDFLSGILGTSMDKLEILLSPSSRYDAQGGIVINVRSKRNKNYGLTKSVTVGVGHGSYFRSPVGFALNYRDSTINIYGGYDLNYNKQYYHLVARLAFNNDPSTINMMDHNIRTQANHSLRLGIDYELNKQTTLGLLFRFANNFRKRKIFDLSNVQPGTSDPDSIVSVDISTDASFSVPSLNLYYRRIISAKGSEIVINADYWKFSKKWNENITGVYHDHLGNVLKSPYNLNNNSPARNSVRSVSGDYYLPIEKGSIEAGIKISESTTDNNVQWQQFSNNNWEADSSRTNHFLYRENVYATYVSVLKTYGNWIIQAGIRTELTKSVGNSITLGTKTERRYDDLFPSVNVQYKASKDHLLSLNYKKSIKRFGFDIINPFINLQGQYSYHKGNPYIRPSYFNSVGINWSYKSILIIGSSVSLVDDPISYAYEKGPDNTSHGSYLNFNAGKLFNWNINYTEKLFKGKWTSTASLNILHAQMPDFDGYIQSNSSYSLSWINTITLPSAFRLEISGVYNSSLLDGTVWQSEFYGASAGLTKQVLKSKGSLRLSCTDIFNTQILHFRTRGKNINITSDWKVESRFINLLFTYRFGNLNVKANKNRKTGIEEERTRMGAN